nr:MAG TPA: hypothetical protein [Caudoviricetes sp.]
MKVSRYWRGNFVFKKFICARGIPDRFHCETAPFDIPHILETFVTPPKTLINSIWFITNPIANYT